MHNNQDNPDNPSSSPAVHAQRKRMNAPTKEETDLLAPFPVIPLARIKVPVGEPACNEAIAALRRARIVGFDTESKPIFVQNAVDDGPHVVQLSTLDTAYVFQLHRPECERAVIEILASPAILKAGFGLQSDMSHSRRRFGITLESVLDVNTVFKLLGYKSSTGLRAAVALVFNQRFHKSKRMTTSNWALRTLSDGQLAYAANDAYAALCVLLELNKKHKDWQKAMPEPVAALLRDA